MSLFSLLGAIEIGLIFALVALGVYISFRLLRFPDLTVDGSFPLGGAVCAVMIVAGFNPWIATLGATLAGAAAEVGVVLAVLALVTGSIWAKQSWGLWWTWDVHLL